MPPPHQLTFKVADEPVRLGRVDLAPRLSSSGSGRVRDYQLLTASGDDCTTASYTLATSGQFPGDVASAGQTRTATFAPVMANCVRFIQSSSWGGDSGGEPVAKVTTAASLAEFTAFTAAGDPVVVDPSELVIPAGAMEITDGSLRVRLHPTSPQVVDHRLDGEQLPGRIGGAITSVLINGTSQNVTVGEPPWPPPRRCPTP